jgi:hypothetical protein
MSIPSVCYIVQVGNIPLCRCSGKTPPRIIFFLEKHVTFLPHFSCRLDFRLHCWEVFQHMVFADGFLFLVKELGLLTNPSHWFRVLDATVSYMYIVL